MMNKEYIEKILDKYWDAETSASQEAELVQYFNSTHVDPALAYAVPYFKAQQHGGNAPIHSIAEKLLTKYFEAETTEAEEGILRSYFAQEDIAPALKKYKTLFNVFSKEATVSLNKEINLPSSHNATTSSPKVINMSWVRAAAATVLLGIAGMWMYKNNTAVSHTADIQTVSTSRSNVTEIEDPEEALAYTMEALAMVSSKYRKGQQQLLNGMSQLNNATHVE
jgi:hypothetical protein